MKFYTKKNPDKGIDIPKGQVCELVNCLHQMYCCALKNSPTVVILSKNVYCYC